MDKRLNNHCKKPVATIGSLAINEQNPNVKVVLLTIADVTF